MVPNLQATVGVEILLRICGPSGKPEKTSKFKCKFFMKQNAKFWLLSSAWGRGGGGGVGTRSIHDRGSKRASFCSSFRLSRKTSMKGQNTFRSF